MLSADYTYLADFIGVKSGHTLWSKSLRRESFSTITRFVMKTTHHNKPDMDLGLAQNFQTCLRNELERRCKANPAYSLRAFAKFLGVDPSFLSKVLSGKREVTRNWFASWACV